MDDLIKVYLSGRDYKAEGHYDIDSNELIVFQGSRVAQEEPPSFREYANKLARIREKLINDGIISNYEFVEDYRFDMPYHAAGVVQASGQAGGQVWKTLDGKTINDINRKREHVKKFQEYLSNFQPDISKEEVDQVIRDFQERFPLENLKDLSIEEYDRTGDTTTLTYAIEHDTSDIFDGYLKRPEQKIFFQREDGDYDTIKWIKSSYPDKSLLEIFELYKEGLYELIEDFDMESYVRGPIKVLPENTNIIRSKLLMLYRPYNLLHLRSLAVIKKILDYFRVTYDDRSDSIELNIKLVNFINENIETDRNIVELSRAIWNFYKETINIEEDVDKEKVRDSFSSISFQDLFIEDNYIREIVNVLKRKKNIILRGVPGVGKTFSINTIIKGSFDNVSDENIEMVQFHQSYSYEEFVEGLRPQMGGGFNVEKGLFYELVIDARGNPEKDYFLIIDEINRGNLSKIFGELLLLIENDKRDSYSVKTAYSKEEFSVPSNLYIIGTMNTSDRSLTLVDYALRRRFSFLTLEPAFNTDKFNFYLENKMGLDKGEIKQINSSMERVNKQIENTLGEDFKIGHSYFIASKEDIGDFDSWYNEIVKYEILPMLEEYYFDDRDKLEEFKEILGV